MTTYELKQDAFEFRANGINSTADIENEYIQSEYGGKTIIKTADKGSALAALAKHTSTADKYPGTVGTLIRGNIYYVEGYEADEDGEFIEGSDFDFSNWDTDIFANNE